MRYLAECSGSHGQSSNWILNAIGLDFNRVYC